MLDAAADETCCVRSKRVSFCQGFRREEYPITTNLETTDFTPLAHKIFWYCYDNWNVHTVSDKSKPRGEIPTVS